MRRAAGIVLGVLVLLAVAAVLGAGALVNTAPVRTAVLDAVQRATGQAASIGTVSIGWSLTPAVALDDVALQNPPGFSRPNLLTVRRVEARIALLPLLQGRVEVRSLSVVAPDLLLERDAAGRGNWQAPPAPPPTTAAPAAPRARTPVQVQALRVTDGRAELRGLPPVTVATLQAAPAGGPLSGTVAVNGVPLTLTGQTGAAGPQGTPFDVALAGDGLSLALNGQAGADTSAAFTLKAASLTALGTLAGQALPPVQDVVLAGRAGQGGLSGLSLRTGALDLGSAADGLRLVRFEATAAAPGQPVQAAAALQLGALPIAVTAAIGGWAGSVPVQAQVTAGAATATIEGTADLAARTAALAVAARVPDLQRLGSLAGLALPALTDASIDARVLPGPAADTVLLRGLRIGSAQGDLSGDVAIGTGPRRSLRGSLVSQRLDLDAWTALPTRPAAPVPAAPPPLAPAQPAPPAPWLIPDEAVSFAALQRADADIRLAAAQITYRAVAYRALDARLLLQDGRLRLDPATVGAAGGTLQAVVQVDSAAVPPTAALLLRGPTLDAAALSTILGWPGALTGAVDVDTDLHAAGGTPHAMAASLTGRLALAMTDGDVDNGLLALLAGPALRGAGLGFDPAGRSRIRCLGARFDVTAGQATMPALALDTTRLRMEGEGRLDLAAETMDLKLRPVARIGPTSVTVPLTLTGPFRSPRPQLERGGIAPGRLGFSIGAAAPDPCANLATIHQRAPAP